MAACKAVYAGSNPAVASQSLVINGLPAPAGSLAAGGRLLPLRAKAGPATILTLKAWTERGRALSAAEPGARHGSLGAGFLCLFFGERFDPLAQLFLGGHDS